VEIPTFHYWKYEVSAETRDEARETYWENIENTGNTKLLLVRE